MSKTPNEAAPPEAGRVHGVAMDTRQEGFHGGAHREARQSNLALVKEIYFSLVKLAVLETVWRKQ